MIRCYHGLVGLTVIGLVCSCTTGFAADDKFAKSL